MTAQSELTLKRPANDSVAPTPARWMAAGLAAALLAACGSDEPNPATAPVVPTQKVQAPADPTAKMARAVTVGQDKSVPLELKYEIAAKPIVNEPVDIELAVVPGTGADSLSISFVGSPGLVLSADAVPNIENVKSGHVERVKFTAMAKEDAVYYVTVTATLYIAGTSSPRTFAIPLIVSAPAPTAAEAAPAAAATVPAKQ